MDKEQEHDPRCACGVCLQRECLCVEKEKLNNFRVGLHARFGETHPKDEIDAALDKFAEAGVKAWSGVSPRELRGEAPQTAPDERETSFLYLRCQPADKSSWVKAAQRKGQKLTEWVKDVLRREAK